MTPPLHRESAGNGTKSSISSRKKLKKAIAVDDWGCGSGIARQFYQRFSDLISIRLHQWIVQRPEFRKRKASRHRIQAKDIHCSQKVLFISHVLTELSELDKSNLIDSLKLIRCLFGLNPVQKKKVIV